MKTSDPVKRRKSRAANAFANPVTQAIRNARPIAPELVQDMRLREWSAMESFATGRATGADARLILEMHCMCCSSMALGIGIEAREAWVRATDVLGGLFDELVEGELMRMDPEQLAVVRELQDLHDQQRAMCSRSEYLQILREADATMESGMHPDLAAKRQKTDQG